MTEKRRICPRCGVNDRGRYGYCPECRKAYAEEWRAHHPGYNMEWRARNPEAVEQYRDKRRLKLDPKECDWCGETFAPKAHRSRYCSEACGERGKRLGTTYGLTAAQFRLMLDSQGHRCDICLGIPEGWHVDHDHETGVIRALLCKRCNWGLGWFNDDPDLLARAAIYLRKHHQQRLRVVE